MLIGNDNEDDIEIRDSRFEACVVCRDYVVLMRVTLVLCIDVMRGSILLFLFACCIYTGSFGLKLCDINFGGPTKINVCLQFVSLHLSRTMQDEAAGGEGLQQGRVANIQSIFRRPDKFKFRPANSHGFAVCLTVLASISRSHEFVFISHGFSKTYFQFTNAAIFKMFRFYLAFPLQILCMILCKISLFCVIVLESTALLTSLVGLE